MKVGQEFGFEGVATANADRYLHDALSQVKAALWSEPKVILQHLKKSLDVMEFIAYLLADINNQAKDCERAIDRDTLFNWVEGNLLEAEACKVFYDEDRASDYEGQQPSRPAEENKYQPFLDRQVNLQQSFCLLKFYLCH